MGKGGAANCGSVWQLNESGENTQEKPPILCHHASYVAGGETAGPMLDCRDRTASYPALRRLGTTNAQANSKLTHARVGEINLHPLLKDKPSDIMPRLMLLP